MVTFTAKQKEIRSLKQSMRLHMANLRSDISAATSKQHLTPEEQKAYMAERYAQLDKLTAEASKHPDIAVKVRILVSYADGEFADSADYISSQKDFVADALVRYSENNKYYRELIAGGSCEVEAFPVEIFELDGDM